MSEEVLEHETVHFTIHGEDLTRLTRSIWADELNIEAAMNILVNGLDKMTEDVAIKILTGRGKLTGVNLLDLEPDNATTTEYGNQLSMAAVLKRILDKKEEAEFRALHLFQEKLAQQRLIASPWGAVLITECAYLKYIQSFEAQQRYDLDIKAHWDEIEKWVEFPAFWTDREEFQKELWGEEIHDREEFKRHRRDFVDKLDKLGEEEEEHPGPQTESIVTSSLLGTGGGLLGAFMEKMRRQDELADIPPEPETDWSAKNGWIDPQGRFYACGEIEHEFLAERMGEDSKDLEKTHVKISTNLMSGYRDSVLFAGKKLTKRQQTAIWDWCQHHNQECPDWVFNDKDEIL